MPLRFQRRRTKGWCLPPNAVYVGRPKKWGNPFKITAHLDRQAAVTAYRSWLLDPNRTEGPSIVEIQRDLRGHDLVCWCPLGEPCHADVLIEVANGPVVTEPKSAAQLRAEHEALQRQILKRIREGRLTVPYKGHWYTVLYLGPTKHGRRCHLEGPTTASDPIDFWIDAALVEPGIVQRMEAEERDYAERRRRAEENTRRIEEATAKGLLVSSPDPKEAAIERWKKQQKHQHRKV